MNLTGGAVVSASENAMRLRAEAALKIVIIVKQKAKTPKGMQAVFTR